MRARKSRRLRRLSALAITVSAATIITACDTSNLQSGIEGTGFDTTTATVSQGPIQSIDGSGVAVNGVTWSAAQAETFIDGATNSPMALKPGMMATVQGERTASDRGTANVIRTQIVASGPIREIDGAMYRLNVLGQTVLVDRRTHFDVPGASLDALSVGQVVAVSGFVAADGEVRATLIATSMSTGWTVNGAVTAVATSDRRFAINGLEIVYDTGALAVPSGVIELEQLLTVSGRAFTDDGALVATSIASYDRSLPPTSGETVLSGMIAKIESDGISFWTQRIVVQPGTTVTGTLAVGSYVRVAGTVRDGILYASDVQVLATGSLSIYLVGYIDAVDVTARTLTMLGVEFDLSDNVRLEHLAVGDRVRVLAYPNRFISEVEGGMQWPYAVERLVLIEGQFGELSPPTQFTLRGVADWIVQVAPTTRLGYSLLAGDGECYGSELTPPERFWQLAAQPDRPVTTVWTWGRFEGGIFLAKDVGICYPTPP